MKVYLSSTSYSEEPDKSWKIPFKEEKSLYCYDPLNDYYGEMESKQIVENDKTSILVSDVVVAYIAIKTFGTSMEILFSYMNNIPVYLIDPTGKYREDYWLKYHVTEVFDSCNDCLSKLKERAHNK